MNSNYQFAVVDVETTGGHAGKHRVIEIGIAIVENGQISSTYESYVNPGIEVPKHITALTGISTEDIDDAPEFNEIIEEVDVLLNDKVFVAQNVNFDYSFIKKEYSLCEKEFRSKRLCTSRYARKSINGLRSSSLKSLSNYFEVSNENPHRALSDAITAARILIKLMDIDDELVIAKELMNPLKSKVTLPVKVNQSDFDNLPGKPGVYFFYGEQRDKPIYIGKAINIKKRVSSHFNGDIASKRTQSFFREIQRIEFKETGSDLLAYLYEDMLIRKYWPKYNSAQKSNVKKYGVIAYKDQRGNWRLTVNQIKHNDVALKVFYFYSTAMQWLHEVTVGFELNPQYCGLLSLVSEEFKISDDSHNENFQSLMNSDFIRTENRLILEKGRSRVESSLILIQGFKPIAYCFFPKERLNNRNLPSMDEMELLGASSTSERIIENYIKKKNPQLLSYS